MFLETIALPKKVKDAGEAQKQPCLHPVSWSDAFDPLRLHPHPNRQPQMHRQPLLGQAVQQGGDQFQE